MNSEQNVTAPFAAASGSASIYVLVKVLLDEGAPLDHVTIAQRMGVPPEQSRLRLGRAQT